MSCSEAFLSYNKVICADYLQWIPRVYEEETNKWAYSLYSTSRPKNSAW